MTYEELLRERNLLKEIVKQNENIQNENNFQSENIQKPL